MIKIEDYKEPQHDLPTEKFLNPSKVYLPLSQHTGKPSTPAVKVGDMVEEGQVIATQTALICASIHSPCQGPILRIENYYHPNLKRAESIFIENSGVEKEYKLRKEIDNLVKDQLLEIVKNSGIVGLGGAAFPTHVKLTPPKKIDTLIINGCECEPYLACDYRLMVENTEEIFKGVEIISKIIEPKNVIFAVEDNKPDAIKNINLLINAHKYIKLRVIKTNYPQGGEKQLIYAVTKRKVPGGKLPFDVGCLVHNVATIFAIYESVYWGKPLIERLVSFAGDALTTPKNIWVKIGTTLQELFDNKILQFKGEPKKIICGGPMMGVALDSLNYPILKGTGGFLFLNEPVSELEEQSCIRCARCVDACPMNLLPLEYPKRIKKEEYNSLNDFNINDCIECGCCAYECPAKIPLVHYIKIGKRYLPK